MNIAVASKEINTREPRVTVQIILHRWLPLSDALLRMVVRSLPNPMEAQKNRFSTLVNTVMDSADSSPELPSASADTPIFPPTPPTLPGQLIHQTGDCMKQIVHSVDQGIINCSISAPSVVVYISKMIPVRVAELSQADLIKLTQRMSSSDNSSSGGSVLPDEVLMGFGRVFSGELDNASDLYVLGHRHNPFTACFDQIGGESSGSLESSNESEGVVRIPKESLGLYICLGMFTFLYTVLFCRKPLILLVYFYLM